MRVVHNNMVKRNAEFVPSTCSGVDGSGVKAGWSEVAARSGRETTTIETIGQANLRGVPVSHVELVPATVAEEEGHATFGRVPASHGGRGGRPRNFRKGPTSHGGRGGRPSGQSLLEIIKVSKV